jgi:hypothetical protein
MMTPSSAQASFLHDPRKLGSCLLSRSKRWWIATTATKIGSVVLGALSVIFFPKFKLTAVIVFVLYVTSELFAWRSDSFKALAQAVLRKLDFRDSFGWQITGEEMSDLIVGCPTRLRRTIPPPGDDDYFSSKNDVGPVRALQNLQESSWWSKHLARRMSYITTAVAAAFFGGSLVVLLISINAITNLDTLASIARVVTSALMLVLSLGLFRLTLSYYSFGRKAELAENESLRLLAADCNELEAVKAWQEYHVARTTAPPIPTLLWKWMNKDLNEAWIAYRAKAND